MSVRPALKLGSERLGARCARAAAAAEVFPKLRSAADQNKVTSPSACRDAGVREGRYRDFNHLLIYFIGKCSIGSFFCFVVTFLVFKNLIFFLFLFFCMFYSYRFLLFIIIEMIFRRVFFHSKMFSLK